MSRKALKKFVERRGVLSMLAESLGVDPPLVSQWANGKRPVPEDRAPAIEYFTGFRVPVETLCPRTRWIRVPDSDWGERGRPLIDKSPRLATPLQLARAVKRRLVLVEAATAE